MFFFFFFFKQGAWRDPLGGGDLFLAFFFFSY